MNSPVMKGYGARFWYNDENELHREDGPAIEWIGGGKEWWYNGEYIGDSWHGFTQERFDRHLRSLNIKEYW